MTSMLQNLIHCPSVEGILFCVQTPGFKGNVENTADVTICMHCENKGADSFTQAAVCYVLLHLNNFNTVIMKLKPVEDMFWLIFK